jgi:hypothetical protein
MCLTIQLSDWLLGDPLVLLCSNFRCSRLLVVGFGLEISLEIRVIFRVLSVTMVAF